MVVRAQERRTWRSHTSRAGGETRITARDEQIPAINISPLRVQAARRGEAGYSEVEIPSSYYFGLEDAGAARNVAGVYRLMAQDLRHGTHAAPDFEQAVALHRVVDAIERAAETGQRVTVGHP